MPFSIIHYHYLLDKCQSIQTSTLEHGAGEILQSLGHQRSELTESGGRVRRVWVQTLPTPWSEGVLLLHLHLLTGSCWDVVVDSLVMVIHSYCQHFLGIGLANNVLIEVGIDLFE